MKERISPQERRHFEFIYENVQATNNFPKTCNRCGKKYQSELDYTEQTVELEGVSNFLDVDILHFHRNCDGDYINPSKKLKERCNSTMGLNLDGGNGNKQHWVDFLEYVNNRAKRDGKNFDETAQEVREEYNKIFLPRQWAEEQMRTNAWAYEDLEGQLKAPLREIPGMTCEERTNLGNQQS